jgi:hypothetical protein
MTRSNDFPTTHGAFRTTYSGNTDAFVTKINAAGSAFLYSTFLGGKGTEHAQAIVVDSAGCVHVTGDTTSRDFPITRGAFHTIRNSKSDVFVLKLNTR